MPLFDKKGPNCRRLNIEATAAAAVTAVAVTTVATRRRGIDAGLARALLASFQYVAADSLDLASSARSTQST